MRADVRCVLGSASTRQSLAELLALHFIRLAQIIWQGMPRNYRELL